MAVSLESTDVGMEISAPPPSYSPMTVKIKSFFYSSPTPFSVPNDFDTAAQKGFKSNSWFSKKTAVSSTIEQDKAIRRVASVPNTNLLRHSNNSAISIPSSEASPLQRLRKSCRRTYSSSSIKVKKVEVGPSSFVKIRMLGKGDVGKVYMVKQKETDKLFAMKGTARRNNIRHCLLIYN